MASTERERASSSRPMRETNTTRSECSWEREGRGEVEERAGRVPTSLESCKLVALSMIYKINGDV